MSWCIRCVLPFGKAVLGNKTFCVLMAVFACNLFFIVHIHTCSEWCITYNQRRAGGNNPRFHSPYKANNLAATTPTTGCNDTVKWYPGIKL